MLIFLSLISKPAFSASNLPLFVRSTSTQPVNLFSRFQILWPCLTKIKKKLTNNNILISAHGNSIRALCKYLFKLDNNQISKLEIPTGNPLLINFNDENKITDCKYLDNERAKDLLVF